MNTTSSTKAQAVRFAIEDYRHSVAALPEHRKSLAASRRALAHYVATGNAAGALVARGAVRREADMVETLEQLIRRTHEDGGELLNDGTLVSLAVLRGAQAVRS